MTMLQHYFSTAVRNFWRFKLSTLANVLCLAFGLTCFLCGYGVFAYFYESDRGFENSNRIYVATSEIQPAAGGDVIRVPFTSGSLAEYLRLESPQLERVARASVTGAMVNVEMGEKSSSGILLAADAEFLRIFAVPFLSGNAEQALLSPTSVVISKRVAQELFGTVNAIGKTVRLQGRVDATVSGVMDKISAPSHFYNRANEPFEVLVNLELGAKLPPMAYRSQSEPWSDLNYFTYALFPKNGKLKRGDFDAQLRELAKRHVPKRATQLLFRSIPVGRMEEMLLAMSLTGPVDTGLSFLGVLLISGSIVLLIAIVNYANLSAAQAAARRKEMGMRRVLGATHGQIVRQCVFETTLLCLLALALAVSGFELLKSMLLARAGVELHLSLLTGLPFIAALVVLLCAVSLTAAIYPAARFAGTRSLPSTQERMFGDRGYLGKIFAGAQFAMAGALLIFVFVMQAEYRDLRRVSLGATADQVVVISNPAAVTATFFETLRQELQRYPQIKAVAASNVQPWSPLVTLAAMSREELGAKKNVSLTRITADYFDVLDMKLLAGRLFDEGRSDDFAPATAEEETKRVTNIVVDREFAEQFGWRQPRQAIDRIVYSSGKRPTQLRIIGVVERQPVTLRAAGTRSSLFMLNPQVVKYPLVRLDKNDLANGLAAIDATWKKLAPNTVLQREFVDALFERAYRMYRLIFNVLTVLVGLAFGIAVMGMVGMATHVVGQRTHEIGIRKTLGASASGILLMLLRDFSRPVVIANLVAWPFAYLAARAYLGIFTYRVPLTMTPFLLSLAIAVFIACASVAWQVRRAARLEPAEVLRYE